MKPSMRTSLLIGSIIIAISILAELPPGILIICIATIPASTYLLHKTTPQLNKRYSLPWQIAAHLLSYLFTANLITGPIITILLLLIAGILHLTGTPFHTTTDYLFSGMM